MTEKIKYRLDKNGASVVPCPHMKVDKFFACGCEVKVIARVGSVSCENCKHFAFADRINKIVGCNK